MNLKYRFLTLTLLLSVLLGLGRTAAPAQAQEELNTILARAAANSFLTTLTRPDLAAAQAFYLLDSGPQNPVLAQLQDVTAFAVTEAGWVSDVSYQVKAVVQPGNREIAVYTGKYNGRWRVEGLDLPATAAAEPATLAAPAAGSPAIAGNGSGTLVFQTRSGGQIYAINANGTDLRPITTGLDPQLSPDGSQIAFTRWEPQYELFTVNLDGSNERAWAGNWRQMKSPTWSADGASLVFSWQTGGRLDEEERRINLQKAAMAGNNIRVPDNARKVEVEHGILTFTIPADAYWGLKQVNLTTGAQLDLGAERHSYGPSAHPTQANLVIYRGDRGLALQNLDTGAEQVITADGRDHSPVLSPDGGKIAVSYWQDGHWEVHVLNADGSGRQRLTSTPLTVLAANRQLTRAVVDGKERVVSTPNPTWNNAAPVWSPDGSQLAFLTDRTGQWEIWLMQADGTNQRPMFPNGALDGLTLSYAGVDERMLSWR
jgi:Tol biopolymer transport system component